MNKLRPILVFAAAAASGGITPLLLPSDWLGYALIAGMALLLIFGVLAGMNAEPKEQGRMGLVWWLVIGTSSPTARINDPQALVLFFLTLIYLAGFTVGAFGAVHV